MQRAESSRFEAEQGLEEYLLFCSRAERRFSKFKFIWMHRKNQTRACMANGRLYTAISHVQRFNVATYRANRRKNGASQDASQNNEKRCPLHLFAAKTLNMYLILNSLPLNSVARFNGTVRIRAKNISKFACIRYYKIIKGNVKNEKPFDKYFRLLCLSDLVMLLCFLISN